VRRQRHHLLVVLAGLRTVADLLVRLRDEAEDERVPLIALQELVDGTRVVA
jgi:hypothetical protein